MRQVWANLAGRVFPAGRAAMVPKGAPVARGQVEVSEEEVVPVEAAGLAAQDQGEDQEVEAGPVGQGQVADPEVEAVPVAQGQVAGLEVGAVVQEVVLAEEVDQVVPEEEHNTSVLLPHAGFIRDNCH